VKHFEEGKSGQSVIRDAQEKQNVVKPISSIEERLPSEERKYNFIVI
jgi:hypothetical protein